MKKRMLFVFNPKAGKGKIKTHLLDIVDIFNKGGYEVIIRATQGPKDAYAQVKEYADQVDLIVCSGGDGTLKLSQVLLRWTARHRLVIFRQEVPMILPIVFLCRRA